MKKLIVSGPAISDLEGIAAYTEKSGANPRRLNTLSNSSPVLRRFKPTQNAALQGTILLKAIVAFRKGVM